MLRAGIVGLGKMGLSHAAIVGAHPQVKMVAVCDTSKFVLTGFKRYTSTSTYTNYRQMIDEQMMDFIIVATPTKMHYQMVKYALQNGINVFCEKPFSLHYSEGEELVRLASKSNLVTQVGYHNHFVGTFRECKRLLDLKVIGDLTHFTGEAYGPVVTLEKGRTWRSDRKEGGGCLYDYASHVLNLIQEVVGRPSTVLGSLIKSVYSSGVDDSAYALLSLENGLTGAVWVNWSDATYRKMSTSLTIEGKKGKIICDATELKIFLKEERPDLGLPKGWNVQHITDLALPVNYYLRGEEYSAQIDYFVEHVITKTQNSINTFEQGLYTDEVIVKILERSKEG